MSDFIFTTHAKERLQQRSIALSDAESVLRHPDKTVPGKKAGTIKFIRHLHERNIQLVATYLPDQKKWLVVSAWVRGEEDKVPFVWKLMTLPFRAGWWIVKRVLKLR